MRHRQSLGLALSLTTLSLTTLSLTTHPTPALANTAVPINRIDFAGAGGNFTERYGTFEVPDRDTTQPAYGGKLTRYDVHIAKMIEVTQHYWCLKRPNYKGVHFNYQADNGRIFMGQIYISCTLANSAFRDFGAGRPETTFIYDRGQGPERVSIPVLDLNGPKIKQFQRLVDALKPKCISRLCPGDRI